MSPRVMPASSKTARSLVVLSAVLLIGLAVYLNYQWFYDPVNSIGYGDNNMEDNLGGSTAVGGEGATEENYFTSTVLNRQEARDEAVDVLKLITENEIEIIQTTPTKMKMYMQDKSDLAWLSHLKVIILGGEVFPESLYEELRHYTDARIWNIYGPTETTVWSSVDEVTSHVITIGNPIANTQILICNEKGELCPVGIAGELCIAGDGVCRGYLNREELTAEKFIDNPYVPGKLYKTGDLASYRTDGKLLCYPDVWDAKMKAQGRNALCLFFCFVPFPI